MSSIAEAFHKVKKENRKGAFIPYFIAGYPDIKTSFELIKQAAHYSDIIEIGIPFSDPIADGKIIQQGASLALNKGINLELIFTYSKELTLQIKCPVVYMMYFNQIFTYGIKAFIKKIKDIGISGLIIPDLPPDAEPKLNEIAQYHNIDIIYFVSPTSSDDRIDKLIGEYRGFIYLIAVTGVTGLRTSINQNIKLLAKKLKKKTNLPICLGFGISKKEHVKEIYKFADGAIVGSAIIQEIINNENNKNIVDKVINKVKELALFNNK